jgi:hypothetical protein
MARWREASPSSQAATCAPPATSARAAHPSRPLPQQKQQQPASPVVRPLDDMSDDAEDDFADEFSVLASPAGAAASGYFLATAYRLPTASQSMTL